MRLGEKQFKYPHTGDCGVAWFNPVDIEDASGVSKDVSPSVPTWKKSNHILSKAKTKANVQSFYFLLKHSL